MPNNALLRVKAYPNSDTPFPFIGMTDILFRRSLEACLFDSFHKNDIGDLIL